MLDRPQNQKPVTLLLDQEFADVDALNEASREWDIELRQLSVGPGSMAMTQIQSENTVLMKSSFNQKIHQRGATPPGMTSFGVIGTHSPAINFCNLQANGSTIESFEESGSFEALSPSGFDVFGISVTTDDSTHIKMGLD